MKGSIGLKGQVALLQTGGKALVEPPQPLQIRRSPPLMVLRGAPSGALQRMLALGLGCTAVASGYRAAVLLSAGLAGSGPVTVMDRWHLWLAAALLCAAVASMCWRVAQRPTNRE